MTVRLIGANPGLTLFADDRRTAYVSAWQVDWSERGAGHALVVWHDGAVRVIGPDAGLGRWLADTFVRHFPEVAGLPWPDPVVTVAPVAFDLDPATGLTARGDDVELMISGPLDRRLTTADAVELGGTTSGFSTVYIPCANGTVTIDGHRVEGRPEVSDGPSSTAFLAVAEVWTGG